MKMQGETRCYELAKPQGSPLLAPWYPSDRVSIFHDDMAQTIHAIGTYVAHGASGIVERQEEVVTKRPWPNNDSSLQELEIEARIY
jgi:hypothetical protein